MPLNQNYIEPQDLVQETRPEQELLKKSEKMVKELEIKLRKVNFMREVDSRLVKLRPKVSET